MESYQSLIEETKQSYYDYVPKIVGGCEMIAHLIKEGEIQEAMQAISNLSEGLEWLTKVETHLLKQSYQIDSNIHKATSLYQGINAALEAKDYAVVAVLFEKQIKPLFITSEKWVFEEFIC